VEAGGNIFYTDGKHLLFGHIFDTGGRDITQEAVNRIMEKRVESEANLDDALRIGNGRHRVIEFTDPLCPFCRQAEKMMDGADMTRYIFFYPLPRSIYCAPKIRRGNMRGQ